MGFPKDFVWGAATASYQIEGAAYKSGGGESVWDMFCRRHGKVYDGGSGEFACDHYHRYREDVQLMSDLELQAYRFSISWPRVMPTGTGAIHQEGLDFYDKLVDELLAKGITPWATLFHWDFPYDLYLRGGWLNPDSSHWFADYTAVIVDKLSDRVKHWMTINEPQCFIGLGHESGNHAPGDKLGMREVMAAAHNANLAHGRAVQVIRARSKQPCLIGYAPVGVGHLPETESAEDIEAARQSMFTCKHSMIWNNAWWLDPLYLGHYPEDGLKQLGADAPKFTQAEMDIISQPLDFIGGNLYNGVTVRANGEHGGDHVKHHQGMSRTMYHWPVTPKSLYWMTRFYYERYKSPIVITENGMASTDWIALDGHVHDGPRIDFLHRYLLELERATNEGIPTLAYFHWSLLDNFEWNEGYKLRFGLTYVDYATQKRTLKDSAYWYRNVIRTNGESLHASAPHDVDHSHHSNGNGHATNGSAKAAVAV
jgi:beta-glucosidase